MLSIIRIKCTELNEVGVSWPLARHSSGRPGAGARWCTCRFQHLVGAVVFVVPNPPAVAAAIRLRHAYVFGDVGQCQATVATRKIDDACFLDVVSDALEPLDYFDGKRSTMCGNNVVDVVC